MTPQVFDVPRCCRCGCNHKALVFTPFKRHAGDPSPTHWATCPDTGEPIAAQLTGARLGVAAVVELQEAGVIAGALSLLESGEIEAAKNILRSGVQATKTLP